MKTQQPKIKLENLHWAYSETTGVVPYIFNKDCTLIKLYSKQFDFKVIKLGRHDLAESLYQERACATLREAFYSRDTGLSLLLAEPFYSKSSVEVMESSFSKAEIAIRLALAKGYDNIRFTEKEVEKMRVSYNKRIKEREEKEHRKNRKKRAIQQEQDDIMSF